MIVDYPPHQGETDFGEQYEGDTWLQVQGNAVVGANSHVVSTNQYSNYNVTQNILQVNIFAYVTTSDPATQYLTATYYTVGGQQIGAWQLRDGSGASDEIWMYLYDDAGGQRVTAKDHV